MANKKKAAAEKKPAATPAAKPAAETPKAAAPAKAKKACYVPTKGLSLHNSLQNITFHPGVPTPAKMDVWMECQLDRRLIQEVDPLDY